MKNLQTLIKLRKLKLDELLLEVSNLEQHIAMLEDALVKVAAEMNVEIMKHENSEFRFALDDYLVGARQKRKNLLEQIVVTDNKITKIQVQIHEEFGEMKKLEIALKNRLEEARLAAEAAEAKEFDEIAIMRASKEEV